MLAKRHYVGVSTLNLYRQIYTDNACAPSPIGKSWLVPATRPRFGGNRRLHVLGHFKKHSPNIRVPYTQVYTSMLLSPPDEAERTPGFCHTAATSRVSGASPSIAALIFSASMMVGLLVLPTRQAGAVTARKRLSSGAPGG